MGAIIGVVEFPVGQSCRSALKSWAARQHRPTTLEAPRGAAGNNAECGLDFLRALGQIEGTRKETLMPIQAPDLTQRPPRSPRVRLGGYVILPRMLDKGRATLNNKAGEYHFNCPLDERFLTFVGIKAEPLKKQLAQGKGDGEMLAWIEAQAKFKRTPFEIAAWSAFNEQRAPADVETRKYFNDIHATVAPKREDLATWFDLLDVDDLVTFGGKA
jgi:hypothetical protein